MNSAIKSRVHLLYPSSPLRKTQPDEQFAAEANAVCDAGFAVSFFSLEDFQNGSFRTLPPLPQDTEILYRGWMLTATDYESLVSNIVNAGARAFTDLQGYLSNHHLPNWYPLISEFTPETKIYSADCDLEFELRALGWEEFFIKDFVKSLKTSIGSRIFKPEQVTTLVAEMQRFRGTIEGGFCVRRVEDFLSKTEQRYFVLGSKPYAAEGEIPQIVYECAKRLRSRFYSVDVIQRADGEHRVVEIGDGQVSDLVGWEPKQFAGILAEHFQKN